jgi:hypothetical protein
MTMSLTRNDLESIRQIVREEIQGVENDVKEIYRMLKGHDKRFNRLERRVTKLEQIRPVS